MRIGIVKKSVLYYYYLHEQTLTMFLLLSSANSFESHYQRMVDVFGYLHSIPPLARLSYESSLMNFAHCSAHQKLRWRISDLFQRWDGGLPLQIYQNSIERIKQNQDVLRDFVVVLGNEKSYINPYIKAKSEEGTSYTYSVTPQNIECWYSLIENILGDLQAAFPEDKKSPPNKKATELIGSMVSCLRNLRHIIKYVIIQLSNEEIENTLKSKGIS